MSSTSSKSSRNRRSSILKVRQTTVDTAVDVAEQQKNRRRVSFHHQKTVKEYDKEKHELSATSPLKEALREAMSDFDSTKSNSTFMSLGTPDRTTGENNTMMLFRGMMSGAQPSSVHQETKDMSFSIIEDPANPSDQNDTLNVFNGLSGGHMSIHSKTVDISYRMEESVNENPADADNTMDEFRKPSNQSTRAPSNMDISRLDNTLTDGGFEGDDTMAVFGGGSAKKDTTITPDDTMKIFTAASGSGDKSAFSQSILMDMSSNPTPVSSQDRTMAVFGQGAPKEHKYPLDGTSEVKIIHDKFINQGKVTIVWQKPTRTTLISDARPEVLRNFLNQLRGVLRGENCENLKEISKEKKSDLAGQVELNVRKRDDYPKTFHPTSLKKLTLSGIGLKRVDGRWFSCTLLTSLDLSRNQMSNAPDLVKMKLISRLVNLQILNLSNNKFARLPVEIIECLPSSLLQLGLSFNLLRFLPSLSSVPSLELLNIANNQLIALPHELRLRRSLSLNLDNNKIKFIPFMLSNSRRTFSITGNSLDEPVTTPDLTKVKCPSMLQWAMQSMKRNSILIDDRYMLRFWEKEGIDFCDYCRKPFAADRLFPYIHPVEASSMSAQAAFNTTYPTRIMACRRCYTTRNQIGQPIRVQPRAARGRN